jgi:hypothetical protein
VTELIADHSAQRTARTAGLFYLIYIVVFAASTFIQSSPVVEGDAPGTARNIMGHLWLFRIGIMSELISVVFFLLAAWALYVLLKPVNRYLALLFVLVLLGGVAVECLNTLNRFAAQLLLSNDDYLKTFTADQLQSLAMFFLDLGSKGGIITGLLYGVWLFPLGYLVIKSEFLPRTLGVLLICDGVSLLVCFFQAILFPGYEKLTYPLYPVMFIAEFGLALWLLIKGVKMDEIENEIETDNGLREQ